MDAQRFDDLIRAFSSDQSRRRLLAGLTSGLLAVVTLTPGDEEASGKRKKRKKKKKKKKGGRCVPRCRTVHPCGGDGCGESCGACIGGTCEDGTCDCPGVQEPCGGECVDPCPGGQARNTRTCGCCLTPRTPCDINNEAACCTEHCFEPPQDGEPFCSGFAENEPCDFDGECFFGSCDDGFCNEPPP